MIFGTVLVTFFALFVVIFAERSNILQQSEQQRWAILNTSAYMKFRHARSLQSRRLGMCTHV